MAETVIEVQQASFGYDAAQVLQGVTIRVSRGEFVGIVGPNGAGKTTLLRAIHALVRPQEGAIFIDGRQVNQLTSRQLAQILAGVSQETLPSVPFTVLEIVLMGRTPYHPRLSREDPKDLAIARWAMERTQTWHLADRPFQSLSGGERQRAVIARALAQQPRILLLDEPTVHLDIAHQLEIMNLLATLNQEGLTILAVLHDLNLAAMYCGRLVLMSEGRVLADGSLETVLKPQWIRRAYGLEVIVRSHPLTGRPYISLLGPSLQDLPGNGPSVHVICGGGTGTALMGALIRAGYRVSSGVLNVLDSDHEAARGLGVDVVEEAPFSPIGEEAYRLNLLRALASEAVVVSPVPFGHGNLKNLEVAVEARSRGVPVFLLQGEAKGRSRDYTGGLAEALFAHLRSSGAIPVGSVEELLHKLANLNRPSAVSDQPSANCQDRTPKT